MSAGDRNDQEDTGKANLFTEKILVPNANGNKFIPA